MHFFPMLVLTIPPGALSQAVVKYDFWNDSPFDDIYWDSFHGLSREVLTNQDPTACVTACTNDVNCSSFIYNVNTKSCEKLKLILVLNDVRDDAVINTSPGNRLFRYLPPAGDGFCKMDRCYYYDRTANACWKLILGEGPQAGGRFKLKDARKACQEFEGRIASLDTPERFDQAVLMLRHIPEIAPPAGDTLWKWLWVGGKRQRSNKPYMWDSGKTVSLEDRYWWKPFADLQSEKRLGGKDCLALTQSPRGGVTPPEHFRLDGANCNDKQYGTICEIQVPASVANAGK
ncbi:uncharacterized protein [Littorina saxatilis]|uniref:C-type lectin domain-containing protein n=1 Tax=Littorina saxatilis TaxID=31220 RepID=A0AAN9C1K9_9CAEN